jgi:hypothetical protein
VENIAKLILIELKMTLPKILVVFKYLPFLMPTYKLHKNNYKLLTNAHGLVFALTSFIVTCVLMKLMIIFNEWVKIITNGYQHFINMKTSFWIVESIIDFKINIPKKDRRCLCRTHYIML